MTLIIPETDTSKVFVESIYDDRKIVVLFPMTRLGKESILRWLALIDTVNSSQVSNLVLIDKTENYAATEYFVQIEGIIPNLIILQRPFTEAIHDSQRVIRIQEGSWIMQFHDDDDWNGFLEIPNSINIDTVLRTQFTLVNGGERLEITDLTRPDCRSIFSLLPANLWNRFTELIDKQGGHVAGSIDSSLNLAVNLVSATEMINDFTYVYDNRHWNSRKSSIKSLTKLTIEDGWTTFPTIQMSLVGRVIDGIASLVFFSEFYTEDQLDRKLIEWIAESKPSSIRILGKGVQYFMLCGLKKFLRPTQKNSSVLEQLELSIRYARILLTAWRAKAVPQFIQIIDELVDLEPSKQLQTRFDFWKSQIMLYSTRTLST